MTEEEYLAQNSGPAKKMTEEEYLASLPPVKGKGHVASAMLNSSGADDLVRGAGHLAEGVVDEASKPEFQLRNNPATMVPASIYQHITNPKGEGEMARARFNAMSLGAMEKGAEKLSDDPEQVKRDYATAAVKHPIESIEGGAVLPAGAGISGVKGVVARPVIQGGYNALSNYFAGKDPKQGFGMGVLGGAGAELLSAPLRASGPLSHAAEENAWRAAQGVPGISDVAKRMGYKTSEDIQGAGRKFLDKGLIPVGGRSADIANRGRKLMSVADNAADATLTKAELSKRPFDYAQALGDSEASMRSPKLSAAGEDASGAGKKFLDQVARQDSLTPGSYLGARKLKSDAYRGVNWDDESPLGAELHRKATLGLRDSIEDQVGKATSPAEAKAMHEANQDFGVGADAAALGDRGARRQAGHQLNVGGLLTRLGIVGGAATHDPKMGAGAGLAVLAEYLTKHRQASALARGEDLASRVGAYGGPLDVAGKGLPAAERTAEEDPWEYFRK